MFIYIAQLISILLLSAWLHPNISKKRNRIFTFLSFIILIVVSGFRGYAVGSDTKVYVLLYNNIDILPLINSRFESGFMLYLKTLHYFSKDPGFLLIVSSFICIGTVCYFTYHFSKKPTISILLYVLLGAYFFQMSGMRQALSLSITMWSFIVILDDSRYEEYRIWRIVISLLIILLATSFHTAAVVAFMPWFFLIRQGVNEDSSKLTMHNAIFNTLILAIFVYVGYSIIMMITARFFPFYASYFFGTWSDPNYFASLLHTLMSLTFMSAGALVFRGKRITNIQRFAVIMLGFAIVFQVLSMRMEIWSRVSGFFNIYVSLLWVPEFLNEIHLRKNRIVTELAIVSFAFAYMLIILIFRPEWTRVVPYVFR